MLSKILISVLMMSIVFSVLAHDKKTALIYRDTIKLLCFNKDMNDSVVGKIISNCKFGQFSDTQDWAKIEDDLIKGCTKKKSLTDRERLIAFCDKTVGKCYFDGLIKKFQEISAGKQPTADDFRKNLDRLEKTLNCVRQYVDKKNFRGGKNGEKDKARKGDKDV